MEFYGISIKNKCVYQSKIMLIKYALGLQSEKNEKFHKICRF